MASAAATLNNLASDATVGATTTVQRGLRRNLGGLLKWGRNTTSAAANSPAGQQAAGGNIATQSAGRALNVAKNYVASYITGASITALLAFVGSIAWAIPIIVVIAGLATIFSDVVESIEDFATEVGCFFSGGCEYESIQAQLCDKTKIELRARFDDDPRIESLSCDLTIVDADRLLSSPAPL